MTYKAVIVYYDGPAGSLIEANHSYGVANEMTFVHPNLKVVQSWLYTQLTHLPEDATYEVFEVTEKQIPR